jgi:hypothetical protein
LLKLRLRMHGRLRVDSESNFPQQVLEKYLLSSPDNTTHQLTRLIVPTDM